MSTSGPRQPADEIVVTKPQLIPWVAVVGVIVTGIAGLFGGFQALGQAGPGSPLHYVGAGACLLAPAVGFGLLTNAIFRR